MCMFCLGVLYLKTIWTSYWPQLFQALGTTEWSFSLVKALQIGTTIAEELAEATGGAGKKKAGGMGGFFHLLIKMAVDTVNVDIINYMSWSWFYIILFL